jgi:hypothetical protein
VDLAPDSEATFTWSFTATAPGNVVLVGNAVGTGESSGLPRQSVVTTTLPHAIFTPVDELTLYPVANLPFYINRGQEGVVPLSLTLHNLGDEHVADALLHEMRLQLKESAEGPGIVPASLFSRVVVFEGTNLYADLTDLPPAGDLIDLTLDPPVRVTGSEPVTIGLRCDVRSDAPPPSFMVSIADSTWLQAIDAVNGQPVPLVLGEGHFPVQSAQATLVSEAAGLAVAVTTTDTTRASRSQVGVPVMSLALSNTSADPLSSAVALGSFTVKLRDADGAAVPLPATYLSWLRVQTSQQIHYAGPVQAGSDTTVTVPLSPPITVAVGAEIALVLDADLQPDAPLGPFHMALGAPAQFDARDASSGADLDVTYQSAPDGGVVIVQEQATTLLAGGTPRLAEVLPVGSREVTALLLELEHPGPASVGAVHCDSLRLQLRDAARRPLPAAQYFDIVRVMSGDTPLGLVVSPTDTSGTLLVSLTGLALTAETATAVAIVIDLKESAPTGTCELLVDAPGVYAHDVNLGTPVAIVPVTPGSLPVTSGITTLVVPAEALQVDFTSQMPAALSAQPTPFPVASITFVNPGNDDGGAIEVPRVSLRAPADGSSVALGSAASEVRILREGEIWAVATAALTDSVVRLSGDEPLAIAAGQTIDLQLELVVREDAAAGALRVGLDARDIDAQQPVSGDPVAVAAVAGKTLPFWSEAGNLAPADLTASYANFPNPFAAGREATTFVYSLRTDAEVSLRLLTPYGETIKTLLDRAPRSAGLHQDDTWTGVNGQGHTVRNGVYLAELLVRYSDGEEQRVLRKVAVVR